MFFPVNKMCTQWIYLAIHDMQIHFMRPDIKSLLPGKNEPLKHFHLSLLFCRYGPWDSEYTQLMWHQQNDLYGDGKKRQEHLNCQPEIFYACCVKCDTMFQLHLRAHAQAQAHLLLHAHTFEMWYHHRVWGWLVRKTKSHRHTTINTNTNTSDTRATLMLLFHYFAATETWLFFFLFSSCFGFPISSNRIHTLVILIGNLIYVRIYHWHHINFACFISLKREEQKIKHRSRIIFLEVFLSICMKNAGSCKCYIQIHREKTQHTTKLDE